jgi:hypothetical protein
MTEKTMTIEEEVAAALKIERSQGEPQDTWLARLARAGGKASDDVFDAFSEPAQEWVNAAVKALKGKSAVPLPEGTEEDAEKAEEPEAAPARKAGKGKGKEAKPAKAAKGGKAAKEKPAKALKAKAERKPRSGKMDKYRETVIRHPDLSEADSFAKHGEGLGLTKTTAGRVHYYTVRTLRAIEAMGGSWKIK